ncbi:pyridoxamine 5'-phosphate oxidase family protein [Sphingobium sp. SJ10-10]|uniref:pyridoxamine 5'-phosphate oxidase family protein n=1 Tax=Sphingobium sp. SJ10-10 TaxID=3114999 RepID=UPI002E190E07|nr:pyridoxamine 5'-phosphate oxidase family protein [Sphingobium sp. SJ10-10]
MMVKDIERDPRVGLSFQGRTGLLKQNPLFIAVEGRADLIRDRDAIQAHWNSDLQGWFEEGPDTPGLVMIRVHAERAHVWDGENEAEMELG